MIARCLERDIRLCKTCRNFDIHSFSADPFGFKGYRFGATMKAASEGCPFCLLLYNGFKKRWPNTKVSFSNGWEDRWWFHLDVYNHTTRQSIESGSAGLMISSLRVTLAPENYTVPYSEIHRKRVPPRYSYVDFHVVADSGKYKLTFQLCKVTYG